MYCFKYIVFSSWTSRYERIVTPSTRYRKQGKISPRLLKKIGRCSPWSFHNHRKSLKSSQKFTSLTVIFSNFKGGNLKNDRYSKLFQVSLFSQVFTSVFTFECIMKVMALSKEFFHCGWNIFDLIIVSASLLDLIFELVDGLSVLRGLRLVRSIFSI